ncbi:MAG TPA: ATP-binding protein [Chloroflexota bacterium]|jgi:signal transduction histidine kinase|nr:ATP-binding protein [Chloroflexota bacterium]
MPAGLVIDGGTMSGSRIAAPGGVLGPRWFLAFWFALAVLSAVFMLDGSRVPVAWSSPTLAFAEATLSGVIGLALLQLGVLRYMVFGRQLDVFAGLGFGVLALANLGVRAPGSLSQSEPAWLEIGLSLLLFLRMAAAGVFLVGLTRWDAVVSPGARAQFARRLAVIVALTLGLGIVAILFANTNLPPAISSSTRQQLQADAPIGQALVDQERWLLLVDGGIALLMLLTSIGYARVSQRLRDSHLMLLAFAFVLLFFSYIHALRFPPIAPDYISAADGFRLAAYLIVAVSLVLRISGEIAESATRDERLRLSRELHDGLAQQLALLNMRLNQAAEPNRPAERRAGDLEAARRLVEVALLEARQAITVLRSGRVSWEELSRTLEAFAYEFAQNHEVEVHVTMAGSTTDVEAELQAELLRMVHEGCSNAIRHGAATRINVALTAAPGRLAMQLQDNGNGFEVQQGIVRTGVGLRSLHERIERRGGKLSIESATGHGTTLRAWLPLSRVWRPKELLGARL